MFHYAQLKAKTKTKQKVAIFVAKSYGIMHELRKQ